MVVEEESQAIESMTGAAQVRCHIRAEHRFHGMDHGFRRGMNVESGVSPTGQPTMRQMARQTGDLA